MLILTRRAEEAIIINGDIKIVIFGQNSHGQYKIGIEAPKDVIIDREEIHNKRMEEKANG